MIMFLDVGGDSIDRRCFRHGCFDLILQGLEPRESLSFAYPGIGRMTRVKADALRRVRGGGAFGAA
jgi:hypothetical protein